MTDKLNVRLVIAMLGAIALAALGLSGALSLTNHEQVPLIHDMGVAALAALGAILATTRTTQLDLPAADPTNVAPFGGDKGGV